MCIMNARASDASLIRLAPGFRSQLDGFEGHEGNIFNDFVEKWALLLKIKLNRHLSSDPG